MTDPAVDPWYPQTRDVLLANGITIAVHVPDAGHAPLIELLREEPGVSVVALTTEEEGVGVACGAWSGGRRSVVLMQSSGVGNCVNALALPAACRIPLLTIVSMRGEWGEFIPWQVPMGQATPAVLEAMDVRVFRADRGEEVADTVDAAARLAFNARQSCAVLLSQRLLGAKRFSEG
jgi:sulfopyruvate decarboxylase alpha subunit